MFENNKLIELLKKYGNVYTIGGCNRDKFANVVPIDFDLFVETKSYSELYSELLKMSNSIEVSPLYGNLKCTLIKMFYEYDQYDIVIGENINYHGVDFNVNNLIYNLNEPDILYCLNEDSKIVKMTDDQVEEIKNALRKKK